ncbi:hypothetical protein G9A89_011676 [Geosiphon pyriformis]|nr:hypothetical protein G9A89_011676 [Geosiphon pyriformis]
MAQNPLQQNILITLQGIQTVLGRKNNTPLPLFRGSSATWFLQETNANAQQKIIRWALANAGKDNTSFTTQFETKFRTPILILKWCIELERRTQGPGEVVTEYAKAIRKLIKWGQKKVSIKDFETRFISQTYVLSFLGVYNDRKACIMRQKFFGFRNHQPIWKKMG